MVVNLEVHIIETKSAEINKDIIATCDKTDYEILCRTWVRSDGALIREWTPHEYITQNPKEKVILTTKIDGRMINVEAHCLEFRNIYAHKNGKRVASFIETIDYGKKKG